MDSARRLLYESLASESSVELHTSKEDCPSRAAPSSGSMAAMPTLQALRGPTATVTLNVGGSFFTTTESTLTRYSDTLFTGLLRNQNHDYLSQERPPAPPFIDRDPTHFRLILNFMRDGVVLKPESDKETAELMMEASFYGYGGQDRASLTMTIHA